MPKHIIQLINKTIVLYLVFFIAIYSPVLMAQLSTTETPKTKIAVLDFKGKNIPATDAMIITDLFRDQLFDTGKFQLLDKSVVENVIQRLEGVHTAAGICDVECAINIGENLQSDKVISGDVSKLGTKYIISIRMVDVSDATLQLTATFEKECRLEDLTLEMPGIISQFLEKYTVAVGNNTAIIQNVPKAPKEQIKTASPFEKIKDFDPIMLFEPKEQSKTDIEIKMLEFKPSGRIKINVDQKESIIFCNSKVLGFSPLAEKEMEAGTYDLKVQKNGFKTYEGKIEVISGKLTELTIKLEKVKDDLKSGVIADKGGSVPKEEEGGGGTIWWILGGAAIVATVVLIASSGGIDTGTLSVTNQTSSAVGISINNENRGTIGANITQPYTLNAGTYTVKISSINLSTKMQSLFAKSDAAESRYNGWNSRPSIHNDKSISSLSGSRRNLSSFSKTYNVEISSGSMQTIVHNNSSWVNGDIRINSTPDKAEIWLNGTRRTELTDATLNDIASGVYTLTLKLSGYPDITDTVQVANGTTTTKDYYFSAYVDLSKPVLKWDWATRKGTIRFWATVSNIGSRTAYNVSVRVLFQDANKLPIGNWTSWQVVVELLQAAEQKDIKASWVYTNTSIWDYAYYTWEIYWSNTPQSEIPMRWQSEPIPIKR